MIEITAVLVVVGVMAIIALPKLSQVAERARAADGLQIIAEIRNSQKRRRYEGLSGSEHLGDFDIEFTKSLYFDDPEISEVTIFGSRYFPVSIQRSDGSYTLGLTPEGVPYCDGHGEPNTCSAIGIPARQISAPSE